MDFYTGHPNTKLFFGHAGINGIYEALFHAVPMLLMPFTFDQPDNAARMTAKGVAVTLDRWGLTEDKLYAGITRVLDDKRWV